MQELNEEKRIASGPLRKTKAVSAADSVPQIAAKRPRHQEVEIDRSQ